MRVEEEAYRPADSSVYRTDRLIDDEPVSFFGMMGQQPTFRQEFVQPDYRPSFRQTPFL